SADPRFGGEYLGKTLSTKIADGLIYELQQIKVPWDVIENPFLGLIDAFKGWVDEVVSKAEEALEGLTDIFETAERIAKEAVNNLATALGQDPVFTDIP